MMSDNCLISIEIRKRQKQKWQKWRKSSFGAIGMWPSRRFALVILAAGCLWLGSLPVGSAMSLSQLSLLCSRRHHWSAVCLNWLLTAHLGFQQIRKSLDHSSRPCLRASHKNSSFQHMFALSYIFQSSYFFNRPIKQDKDVKHAKDEISEVLLLTCQIRSFEAIFQICKMFANTQVACW